MNTDNRSKAPLYRAIYVIVILIGIIVIIFSYFQEPFLQNLMLGIGSNMVVVTIIYIIFQFFGEEGESSKIYKNSAEINQYMFDWISGGGNVAILTRDMSWANNRKIHNMLITKSRKGELTICLPHPIKLTNRLKAEGANITTFEHINYVPQSRFTIINKGRMDSQIAIGRRIDGQHVIEEFPLGEHPIIAVANDLIEILDRVKVEKIDEINKTSKS